MDMLHYTISEKMLKVAGYTFQKLYARNYKSYRKKFKNSYTIWLWVAGKMIEIDDWHHTTKAIVDFYRKNIESWVIENKKLPRPRSAMVVMVDRDTCEVVYKDYERYYRYLMSDNIDKWYKETEHLHEVALMKDGLEEVLKEIDFLTKPT